MRANPDTLLDDMNPREFNKLGRIIWEPMLFDLMASFSGLPRIDPVHRPMDTLRVKHFREKGVIKDVIIILFSPPLLPLVTMF